MDAVPAETRPRELVEINKPSPWWTGPLAIWRNSLRHRFLVKSFIRRDLQITYRNSVLGYFWSLIEPSLLTVTYYFLFTVVAGRPHKHYAMWVIIGVLVWQFFSTTLMGTVTSLTKNASMIRQVYFPREIFAITHMGSRLTIVVLSLLIAAPLMFYFELPPTLQLLWIPVGLALTASLSLGIGLACACLNAVHRDVEHFFRFLVRVGFFLSPVMWTLDEPRLQGEYLDIILLNPMALPISMVRGGIEGRSILELADLSQLLYSVVFCIGAFLVGAMFFKRFEGEAVKSV